MDGLVAAKLRKLGIQPSTMCDDAAFLRRASVDAIGTLPTPAETREFLADPRPDKRARLIDRLLDRPEYALYWATIWSDWTGNAGGVLNPNIKVTWLWHDWLVDKFQRNVPFDQFARGIIVASSLEGRTLDEFLAENRAVSKRMNSLDGAPKSAFDDGTYGRRQTLDLFWMKRDGSPEEMSIRSASTFLGITEQLDTAYRGTDLANDNLAGMDRFYAQAWDILRSAKIREAFELQRESAQMRDTYGRTALGQALLLARRLVEAGVRCITLDFGGWDTHQNNFKLMKDTLLPPWDQGMAALLEDLHQRGMLQKTLVWSTGEMGRTPTINKDAGRDHWGAAMSMMIAGCGIRGGQVIGATDATGSQVIADPCTPADVAASALHALGIPHTHEYHTPTGRPVMIVRDGHVIEKMFG